MGLLWAPLANTLSRMGLGIPATRACRSSGGHRVHPQRRQLQRKLAHGGVQPTFESCQLVALGYKVTVEPAA
jgi:hypothetical protein